jgi:hypothetical protein
MEMGHELYTRGTPEQTCFRWVKNISPFSIAGISGVPFQLDLLVGVVGGRGVALHLATLVNESG